MDHYDGYGVGIKDKDALSLTLVGGIENQSLGLNSQHTAEETAGADFARQGHVTEIKPRGSFSSYSVNTLIDLLGIRGASLAGGANAGFELYQLKKTETGELASGAVHRKLVIPNGLILPRSISVSHRQSAIMSAEVLSIFDGTNNPVIIAPAIAAPTGLDDTHRFSMGEITIGGVTLTGNLSVSIDFGNSAASEGGDSDVYDSKIEVGQILPTISIRGKDVAKFADTGGIKLTGALGTHANTKIVLRRRSRGTGEYSTGADHILITAEAMIAIDDAFSASGNKRGEIGLKLTCLDDGTNAPLVFNTAHTIV